MTSAIHIKTYIERHHRVIAASATIILATGISLAMLWRHRPLQGLRPEAVAQVKLAKAAFDRAPSVSMTDHDGIRNAIRDAAVIPNQIGAVEPTDRQREALAELLASWLSLLNVAQGERYQAWARSMGYRFAPDGEGIEPFARLTRDRWDALHQYFTNSPMPPDMTDEVFFSFAFQNLLHTENERLRPLAVGSGPEAMVVSYRIQNDPLAIFPLEDWPNQERWTFGATTGCTQLWAPPVSITDIIERDSEALTVVAFLPLRNRRGEWIPLAMAAYWDPSSEQWMLWHATIANTLFPHLTYLF